MKDLVFQRQLKLKVDEDIKIDNLILTNDSIIKLFYNLNTNTVRIQHMGIYSNELQIVQVQSLLDKLSYSPYMESIEFKTQLESRFKDYNNEEHNYLLENGKSAAKFINDNFNDLMFLFKYELDAYDPSVHSLLHNQSAIVLNQLSELGYNCSDKNYYAMSIEVQRLLSIFARDTDYYNQVLNQYKTIVNMKD